VVLSWASPPVEMRRKGRPRVAVIEWILVVNPPPERPSADLWPPFPCAACWYAHELGIKHEILVVGVGGWARSKYPFPHPGCGPTGAAKPSLPEHLPVSLVPKSLSAISGQLDYAQIYDPPSRRRKASNTSSSHSGAL
jgi:hypothetical protein